jgi:hypothetical protein
MQADLARLNQSIEEIRGSIATLVEVNYLIIHKKYYKYIFRFRLELEQLQHKMT